MGSEGGVGPDWGSLDGVKPELTLPPGHHNKTLIRLSYGAEASRSQILNCEFCFWLMSLAVLQLFHQIH